MKYENAIRVDDSAWDFVLDALGYKVPEGYTVKDIHYINKADGLVTFDGKKHEPVKT